MKEWKGMIFSWQWGCTVVEQSYVLPSTFFLKKNTVRVSLVQERALFQKIRTKRCCCMSRGEGSIPFQYFYCYLKRREKGSDVIDRQLGGGAELVQGVRRGGQRGPGPSDFFDQWKQVCFWQTHNLDFLCQSFLGPPPLVRHTQALRK